MFRLVLVSLFLFSFGISSSALCASEIEALDLGTIVIAPFEGVHAVTDLSSSVSVITNSELEAGMNYSLTDALRVIPGVFVHKTTPFGRADIVIRGHGNRGRKVMVLIDGKPEKMGLYGCTISHALPVDDVERIEVIRGSSSVLYGSDALGGVINIITKKVRKKNEGDVSTWYGSYDTLGYRLRQGGRYSDMSYYVTFDKIKSRGHLPNSDYWHNHYTLSIEKNIVEDIKLGLGMRYFDGFKREPEPASSGVWDKYKRGSFNLTAEGNYFDAYQMLRLYRNFGHHRFSDNFHSKDYTNGLMFHFRFEPLEGNSLLSGFEFRELGGKVYSGSGVIPGAYDKKERAFFIHDEQRILSDRIIIDGGLRYNRDSISGDCVMPAAGLVVHLTDKATVRTNFERGFRSPHLNELRFLPISNPDLGPEKTSSYEAGFNYRLSDALSFDCVYFMLEADDFIAVKSGKFQNIDSMKFKGVETSLEYSFTPFLQGRLSFTHLDAGDNTQGRPENEIDMLLRYAKGKYTVTLTGQCVDNYFASDDRNNAIPNFFLADVKVGYQISEQLNVWTYVGNIFNVEHKIYADLPSGSAGVYTQPGRNVSFGITYEW